MKEGEGKGLEEGEGHSKADEEEKGGGGQEKEGARPAVGDDARKMLARLTREGEGENRK